MVDLPLFRSALSEGQVREVKAIAGELTVLRDRLRGAVRSRALQRHCNGIDSAAGAGVLTGTTCDERQPIRVGGWDYAILHSAAAS